MGIRLQLERGVSMVEFALLLSFLSVLIAAIHDFNALLSAAETIQSAATEGARVKSVTPILNRNVVACNGLAPGAQADQQICQAVLARIQQSGLILPGSVAITDSGPVGGLYPSANSNAGTPLLTTSLPSVPCDREVTVSVTATYNFWFARLLGFGGIALTRGTNMRYRFQPIC